MTIEQHKNRFSTMTGAQVEQLKADAEQAASIYHAGSECWTFYHDLADACTDELKERRQVAA